MPDFARLQGPPCLSKRRRCAINRHARSLRVAVVEPYSLVRDLRSFVETQRRDWKPFVFSYEAVRDWQSKLAPALAASLRQRRKNRVGRSWYADETYIRVRGRWQHIYIAQSIATLADSLLPCTGRDGSLVPRGFGDSVTISLQRVDCSTHHAGAALGVRLSCTRGARVTGA
jgi:hypothetical protein